MSAGIVSEIKAEIMREAAPEFAERLMQYFKEPIKTHGLRAPQQKKIARKYYHRVKKDLPTAIEVTQEIRNYLLKWREETSALTLRYASEKLAKEMRVLKTK